MFERLAELPPYLGLNDQVYEALKTAIVQNDLPAGSKLDVNQLAKRWGISRTPVNDAIQRLMIDGLVSVIPRRGTFVANIDVKDMVELLDVRLMFELRAAELVVTRLTAEQLGAMKTILAALDKLLAQPQINYQEYARLDLEFHALPVQWTNNRRLYQIYKAQNFQWYMTRIKKSKAGQTEHWDIYNAYASGSLATVKKALEKHFSAGKASITERSKQAQA